MLYLSSNLKMMLSQTQFGKYKFTNVELGALAYIIMSNRAPNYTIDDDGWLILHHRNGHNTIFNSTHTAVKCISDRGAKVILHIPLLDGCNHRELWNKIIATVESIPIVEYCKVVVLDQRLYRCGWTITYITSAKWNQLQEEWLKLVDSTSPTYTLPNDAKASLPLLQTFNPLLSLQCDKPSSEPIVEEVQ